MYSKIKKCLKFNRNIVRVQKQNLVFLIQVPYNISILHCYQNYLTILPHLPLCVELLAHNNNLHILPDLPLCTKIRCCNIMDCLPDLPECKDFSCHDTVSNISGLPLCSKLNYCCNNRQPYPIPINVWSNYKNI